MGAAESKAQGNGTAGGEGFSKAKLSFPPGATVLQSTSVYALRDAYFGKRPVSAFSYDPAQFELDNRHEFLPKAIRKLKTIRHPSVLRFIDCKTNSTGVHLVTERVAPLTVEYLQAITEDEILVGLYDIMVALHFLHSQCHLSHNNVQLGSIFVSNGRWVLGGMEFTGTVAESMDAGLTSLLSNELVPPEHQDQHNKRMSQDPELVHAVDIWQYAKLVESLVQDGLLHVKSGELSLDRMLSGNPGSRPSGDAVLESTLFASNNAVSVVRYCRLKGLDKSQNAEWSHSIMARLRMLPPSIMEQFVLPQLLTQEFFAAEGFDELYRMLFTPQPLQPLISEETYRSQVIPFMVKLWTFRQADIRLTIFRLFEVYLKAVVLGEGGSEVLGQIILPEILTGLQDADSKIYLASLCGLATAIPYALLVTTLVDTDQSKQKFSVKTLYEQTLIPQIMAFWISEDTSLDAKLHLIEVVMGMWCSIYTLGLHSHASVKDVSSTLTLTLVSVLKLSPINERLELIAKSFTKHCTNAHFCVSGLMKFLPQFLLDEDLQVREAAARAIATVAHQAAALATNSDATAEQRNEPTDSNLDVDAASSISTTPSVSSPSSTSSAHVSRIRQYCEKQQTLLPARRPIFSRSTFASERSLSSLSVRGLNGLDSKGTNGSATDLLSSRRSSMVSRDSFMFSEPGSLKTSLTPTRTRAGSFSTEHVSQNSTSTGLESRNRGITADKGLPLDARSQSEQVLQVPEIKESELDAWDDTDEQDMEAAAQLELQRALELAKAEMKMRQLPVDSAAAIKSVSGSDASASSMTHGLKTKAAFGWDASNDDDADNWDSDDGTAMDDPSRPLPPADLEQPAEDEETRLRREQAQAEKQEQLRQKRDQKQQEMAAKREARRQQLAEKQLQKKASSSNGLKLSAVKKSSSPTTSLPATAPAAWPTIAAPKPVSGRSLTQLPVQEKDDWDMDDDIDVGALEKQAGTVSVENELFKDLEVSYKAPAYVGGGGSTTSMTSSTSSATLSNSVATLSTTNTIHSPSAGATISTVKTSTISATALEGSSTSLQASSVSFSQGLSTASTPNSVVSSYKITEGNDASKHEHSASNGNGGLQTKNIAEATAAAPSLALQVDEAALEEDGWGDDWD
ncbi:Protein-associating with the carboxyl-terminal domain of ezrin [Mortierella alpina]|uniref:Protein-associating with the carboxyl-terminal domain of ezrin n=1 Tax=Mortierella alpina TaxID=64518 RepID=A0A9P6J7D2_MORAP|nr:Protein-associating with the carboxyl-terminal domain of ezrin [Mortierella alpina]